MDMLRVVARWTGFQGAPGYSNFFFAGGGGSITDAQQVADRVTGALEELDGVLPSGTTIAVEPEVARVDSDTGMITDFHTIEPGDSVTGTAVRGYSGASGAVVNWRTADLRNGRRIRGRTFLVPLAGDAFDTQGTLSPLALTAVNAFAQAITGLDFDSEFGVWSRPIGGSGGVFATVNGFTVPDMAAVLRSRRD